MESNSGYPKQYAMKGDMIAKTCALSTCLLYYRGYVVAAQAGKVLGEDVRPLSEKAARAEEGDQRPILAARQGLLRLFPG